MTRLAGRATVAGILGLVSLVIPIEIVSYPRFFDLNWTVIVARFFNGRTVLFNATQFQSGDAVLSALVLLTVLAGGILLLALRAKPKVGAVLLLAGVVLYVIDVVYDEVAIRFFGTPIPLGFFLVVAAAIVGLTAKPVKPISSAALL